MLRDGGEMNFISFKFRGIARAAVSIKITRTTNENVRDAGGGCGVQLHSDQIERLQYIYALRKRITRKYQ